MFRPNDKKPDQRAQEAASEALRLAREAFALAETAFTAATPETAYRRVFFDTAWPDARPAATYVDAYGGLTAPPWITSRDLWFPSIPTPGETVPASTTLAGVGSDSDSLTKYPPTGPVTVGDWYVDQDNGNDANAGTSTGAAFATIGAAIAAADPGDTILIRESATAYVSSSRINISKAGLKVFGYGEERPRIDCSGHPTSGFNAFAFHITADDAHLKALEVTGNPQRTDSVVHRGISIENVDRVFIEDIWLHDAPGGSFYNNGGNDVLFMDCVSWAIGDGASSGTNVPDAFVTTNTGLRAKFVRCASGHAPDDAFDCFTGEGAEFIDCFAHRPGRYANGAAAGDGNGIKLGGSSSIGSNAARGCLVVSARSQGIVHNSSPFPNTIDQCTATGCGSYGIRQDNIAGTLVRHNISLGNGINFLGGSPNPTYVRNTWDLGIASAGFADVADFDWSLAAGSACIGAGEAGENLGASTIALELAKRWVPVFEGEVTP